MIRRFRRGYSPFGADLVAEGHPVVAVDDLDGADWSPTVVSHRDTQHLLSVEASTFVNRGVESGIGVTSIQEAMG